MTNAVEILDTGFAYLVERLGVVDAERFIAMVKRDDFDYTIWRRAYFDNMDLEQVSEEAMIYADEHPHEGKGKRI